MLDPILSGLFKEQLDFIFDQHRRVCAFCSRRAGKTFVVTRKLIRTCLDFPGTSSVYIALTRPLAEELVWLPLLRINEEHNLGIKFQHTKLWAKFPNGSMLKVTGADDKKSIEKLRGPHHKLVVIDEAASFPAYLRTLVEEVLEPGLEDLEGTLMVIGTPGAACTGYFFDITNYPDKYDFSLHRWTILDNEMFPRWRSKNTNMPFPDWRDRAASWLSKLKKRKGFRDDDPVWLREWCGIWAKSNTNKMYDIRQDLLLSDEFTEAMKLRMKIHKYMDFVLGVDLGWHDKTAFCIVGYDQKEQLAYEVESIQASGLIVDEMAKIVEQLIELYKPESIVIDGASEGKIIINSLAAEVSKRYGLPVKAAEKNHKAAYVRVLDSDIRVGKALLQERSPLWRQLDALQWDEKYQREVEGMPCDFHDAFLYAYRECLHWAALPTHQRVPKPGDPDYNDYLVEQMELEDERRYAQKDEAQLTPLEDMLYYM